MSRILNIFSAISILAAALAVTSCSMMEDDVTECPTGLYVRFVYDYNTARADMFKDHVGHVRVFVYDESGRKVAQKDVSNNGSFAPLNQYGYAMHFSEAELAPGRYRLQAVAMQKDWDEALATPGAKYRRNDPQDHRDLSVALDRDESTIADTDHHAVSAEAPLDTLWHTLKVTSLAPTDGIAVPEMAATTRPFSIYPLEDQYVLVVAERATYATVSMIRDTKHLNITLRNIDDPDNIFADDYDVYVADANSTVGHDNELTATEKLRYTPYGSWTSRFNEDGTTSIEPGSRAVINGGDTQRTAHYNLMFNRLVHHEGTAASDRNALLKIVNRHSGKTVAEMDLASILAEGRIAYDLYHYPVQEYLDREYDYRLDFLLKGDNWYYCDIVINVLGWSRRKQNESL